MIRRQTDTFILLGLICFLAGAYSNSINGSWAGYLPALAGMLLSQWPAVLFSIFKHRIPAKQYNLSWIAVFCAVLPLTLAFFLSFLPFGIEGEQYVTLTVFTISLQLTFSLNAWWQKQWHTRIRWRKISFEKGLLTALALLAITLAAMAVSSMGNPEYEKPQGLLIGFEIHPGKVFRNFGTWLGIALQFMLMYACGYFIFWLNSRILVSKILKERGILIYCLTALASAAVLYPVIGQLLAWLPLNRLLGGVFPADPFREENVYGFLSLLVISLPVILALKWYAQNSRIISLEKEKTQAELDMLKQQINPHFFFNTLNNLYSLSLSKSDQTPDVILRLSDLMRYVIYKGQETSVPLREEVQYLEDYINLQKIRLKHKLELVFEKQVTDMNIQIAPLLLIVFVENAFKHGIEPQEDESFLRLFLRADEKGLAFICENPAGETEEKTGGIGLENLRKRLVLLYPGKHSVETVRENHTFKAELHLHWS